MSLLTAKNATETTKLLKKGADVGEKNKYNQTVLHVAKSFKIAKLLIDAGADVNAKDKHDYTPLTTAVIKGNVQWINYLVEKGADIDADVLRHANKTKVLKVLLDAGFDPNKCQNVFLHRPTDQIKLLLEYGANSDGVGLEQIKDYEEFKQLLDAGVPMKAEHIHIYLMNAINTDNLVWAKEMMEQGGSPNAKTQNKPLLHLAKSFQMAKLLIETGADPNSAHEVTTYYWQSAKYKYPLCYAIEKGDDEWVNYLIQDCQVPIKNIKNYATKSLTLDTFMILLPNFSPAQKTQVLYTALRNKHQNIVEYMLQQNVTYSSGDVYHYIKTKEQLELLLAHGLAYSPEIFKYAIRNNNLELCQYLLNQGYNPIIIQSMTCPSLELWRILKTVPLSSRVFNQHISDNDLDTIQEIMTGPYEKPQKPEFKSMECMTLLQNHGVVDETHVIQRALKLRNLDYIQEWAKTSPLKTPLPQSTLRGIFKRKNNLEVIRCLLKYGMPAQNIFGVINRSIESKELFEIAIQYRLPQECAIANKLLVDQELLDKVGKQRLIKTDYLLVQLIKNQKLTQVKRMIEQGYHWGFKIDEYNLWKYVTDTNMANYLKSAGFKAPSYNLIAKFTDLPDLFPEEQKKAYQKLFNATNGEECHAALQSGLSLNSVWGYGAVKISYYTTLNNGDTVLINHLKTRSQWGNIEYTKWLLEHGADPNQRDASGKYPIDYCSWFPAVRLLQKHGGLVSKWVPPPQTGRRSDKQTEVSRFESTFYSKTDATNGYNTLVRDIYWSDKPMTRQDYLQMLCMFRSWMLVKKGLGIDIVQGSQLMKPEAREIIGLMSNLTMLPNYGLRFVVEYL